MGTRSLTVVRDGKDEILVMYRQFDGYPSGHGQELADFLRPFTVINGIGAGQSEPGRFANGMGCLAAQLVGHFKKGVGGIYLHKSGQRDCGEEYVYYIDLYAYATCDALQLSVMAVHGGYGNKKRTEKLLWKGPVTEFKPELCENDE